MKVLSTSVARPWPGGDPLLREVFAGAGERAINWQRPDPAGHLVWLQVHLVPELEPDGTVESVLAIGLATRLRQRHRTTPVLYVSGYPDDTITNCGVLVPGVTLVDKPFSVDLLARKVREALDNA